MLVITFPPSVEQKFSIAERCLILGILMIARTQIYICGASFRPGAMLICRRSGYGPRIGLYSGLNASAPSWSYRKVFPAFPQALILLGGLILVVAVTRVCSISPFVGLIPRLLITGF